MLSQHNLHMSPEGIRVSLAPVFFWSFFQAAASVFPVAVWMYMGPGYFEGFFGRQDACTTALLAAN